MPNQLRSLVFIANTGRADTPLPSYLVEALQRFKEEGGARYVLVAQDLVVDGPNVSSEKLRLSGQGATVQQALVAMVGQFNPGTY